jgi:hypothetical protein
VRGWNTEQYLGEGEFYLEYGSFDVSLTVPANMLVAATGTLRNPEQVLTATQRQRLAEARRSDRTVVIRGKDEIGTGGSAAPSGTRIWRFTADSVRDFAGPRPPTSSGTPCRPTRARSWCRASILPRPIRSGIGRRSTGSSPSNDTRSSGGPTRIPPP